MKEPNKNLPIALLILVGLLASSCTSFKDIIDADPARTVTCTTSVSLDNALTKALDAEGVKTFAVGDRIAVIYKSSTGLQKAESIALTTNDIMNGKSATFTVTLTDPEANSKVRFIYPAAMAADAMPTSGDADSEETVKYTALTSQDGTLASLASDLDLCTFDGTLTGTDLPRYVTLDNQFAICAFSIMNGGEDISGNTTKLVVGDGTNTYTVSRPAAAGPIYVAMKPVENVILTVTITDGAGNHVRTMAAKTLKQNSFYPIDLGRIAPPTISGNTLFGENTMVTMTVPDGATIYYTLNGDAPTASSNQFLEAFSLVRTLTVKAIAVKDGISSSVTTKTFTKLAPPVISGDSPFKTQTIVMITTGTGGAKIYYTTDGSDPSSSSTPFESAITLKETTTIKAISFKDGVTSTVASATFTKEASQ